LQDDGLRLVQSGSSDDRKSSTVDTAARLIVRDERVAGHQSRVVEGGVPRAA
jgi:hypothetical protein